jgi:peptide/nickel transport system permease protein
MIPILLGVSLLTYLLMSLAPGDFYSNLAANPQVSPEKLVELRAKRHYDKSWPVRYYYWLVGVMPFEIWERPLLDILAGKETASKIKSEFHPRFKVPDFGYSVAYKMDASSLIAARLWNTFVLSFLATLLAWFVAVPLGIWAAVKKDTWIDRGCALLAFVGLSVPEVLLALLALMFAASTGWFPIGGVQSSLYDLMSGLEKFRDRAIHLVLPVIVLAASDLAGIMRQMRSNLLDSLRAEFVTAARAKGLAEGWVIYKHALRNAINPLLTIFGYSVAAVLSGAFIVENIMAWPGLGRLTIEAFFSKDQELVVATVVMAAALLMAGNFVADLLLAWSDPRIRLE